VGSAGATAMTERAGDAVLVTGASGSLGLETVLTLAERGFRVFAGTRGREKETLVREAADRRRVRVETLRLDVTDEASVCGAVGTVVEVAGGLHGVVSNAGINLRGYFEDLDETDIRRVLEVNVLGTMRLVRRALPHMRTARRGRVVIMSSVAGRIGSMGLTAYVASKFALEGFAESLALELKPLGVHVSILEPGIVKTDIWGRNRRVAPRALDPTGPYFEWFRRAEEQADRLVDSSRLSARDVASGVLRALTDPRPRLRYPVGRRAALVMALRRHLPGELFERLYFGEVLRRVTGRRGFAGAQGQG
jgi:NAD(P)-dependent dehydrogenase (short-subunit alcohol dehydrogenase family)